jgi:hypothetical protein
MKSIRRIFRLEGMKELEKGEKRNDGDSEVVENPSRSERMKNKINIVVRDGCGSGGRR